MYVNKIRCADDTEGVADIRGFTRLMCDEDYDDIDPDASPEHPDAPEPPTHQEA
jgi:hypothetical protein